MWINSDVVDLMKLLREIRDELRGINERQRGTNKQVQQEVFYVRKKKTRKRPLPPGAAQMGGHGL
ncbi:hypothetical protein LCGC14_2305030 [marine sediment metagenome]|uniref:Uncharacterized protein n=1 Tax=marine sediment metagenome TaxID=412755 RepID=A0A0F9D9T7_9ZZZZ